MTTLWNGCKRETENNKLSILCETKTRDVKIVFSWKSIIICLIRFFSIMVSWHHSDSWLLENTGLLWHLMQPLRWVVERQTYKQTGHADWADLLCIWLATRRLLSCKIKLRHLRTFYDPHTPIPDGRPHRLIYLPHPTRETDLSREHSVSCRECGKGRGERRVVNNRCETMSSQSPAVSALSAIWWHWHVTSVVNIICCMQARSLLVSCITVSLANWGQSYDCLPQSVPGA